MGCLTSRILQDLTYENTEPFYPSFTKCKILKVYDGDTLHIAGEVDGRICRFSARMYGYDTPELKSRDIQEKEAGNKAKNALIQKVFQQISGKENPGESMGKILKVQIHHIHEKYGRLLITLYDEKGEDINKWMVDNKYGKPYFGGTK